MTKVINRENVVGVMFYDVGVLCNAVGAAAYVVGTAAAKKTAAHRSDCQSWKPLC